MGLMGKRKFELWKDTPLVAQLPVLAANLCKLRSRRSLGIALLA